MDSLLAKLSHSVAVRKTSKNVALGTSTRLVSRLFSSETPAALARSLEALGIENDVVKCQRESDIDSAKIIEALKTGDENAALENAENQIIESEDGSKAAAELYEKLQRLQKFAVALAAARRRGDDKGREKLLAKFRKGENI